MQFLSKWSDSSHFQHSSEYVKTVICQMGSDDLAMQGLAAGKVETF